MQYYAAEVVASFNLLVQGVPICRSGEVLLYGMCTEVRGDWKWQKDLSLHYLSVDFIIGNTIATLWWGPIWCTYLNSFGWNLRLATDSMHGAGMAGAQNWMELQ